MATECLARSTRPALILALSLLGELAGAAASADTPPDSRADAGRVEQQGALRVVEVVSDTNSVKAHLWLPRTRSDWDSVVAVVRSRAADSGQLLDPDLEEITVTAPAELIPMTDSVYDEMWGGLLAPVWAMMHPTEAWRILLPIPPK